MSDFNININLSLESIILSERVLDVFSIDKSIKYKFFFFFLYYLVDLIYKFRTLDVI